MDSGQHPPNENSEQKKLVPNPHMPPKKREYVLVSQQPENSNQSDNNSTPANPSANLAPPATSGKSNDSKKPKPKLRVATLIIPPNKRPLIEQIHEQEADKKQTKSSHKFRRAYLKFNPLKDNAQNSNAAINPASPPPNTGNSTPEKAIDGNNSPAPPILPFSLTPQTNIAAQQNILTVKNANLPIDLMNKNKNHQIDNTNQNDQHSNIPIKFTCNLPKEKNGTNIHSDNQANFDNFQQQPNDSNSNTEMNKKPSNRANKSSKASRIVTWKNDPSEIKAQIMQERKMEAPKPPEKRALRNAHLTLPREEIIKKIKDASANSESIQNSPNIQQQQNSINKTYELPSQINNNNHEAINESESNINNCNNNLTKSSNTDNFPMNNPENSLMNDDSNHDHLKNTNSNTNSNDLDVNKDKNSFREKFTSPISKEDTVVGDDDEDMFTIVKKIDEED
ncbi:hypothetical protein TRFO_35781 [Tritrichomonas foetus]|uniref:Uncharacterized protein n=1 Tax=Tritrichomonas foetus TaxID=1144522 RepID=A0A1J4JFI5_9EUKA|nr:hypothetical protein TRFO_35781 [Tritrichomonas foetus]|eukprot:OHS97906.1 hypothetical protein TRFO_35781 [Tritrichomonas foetus]